MRMKSGLNFAGLLFALLLVACSSDPSPSGAGAVKIRSDLELTWDKAIVALPVRGSSRSMVTINDGNTIVRQLSGAAPGARWPVILYMHGCTGIGNYDFFQALAERGYVVIAPDSMARRYRPLQCDPETATGGMNLFVYEYRLAEVAYAAQQLRQMGWVDQNRLYLVGASEGGVAAALYRGDEFAARVIAGWTCLGAPLVRGIAAPSHIPVLSVVSDADPWYGAQQAGAGRQRDCGAFMADRPNSKSMVLKGSGRHNLLMEPIVFTQLMRFLDLQLFK